MAAEGSGLVLARSLGTSGQGVLALILAPSHLPPLTLPLRRDQALRLLVDPNDGTVLAVQPRPGDAAPAAGATLLLPRLMAALRTGREAGVVLARDATGARRLIGYGMVPAIAGVGAGRVAMLVELPYDTLLDEADARRRDQWLAALALGLLGAASAWVLAQRSLVRPVGRLLAATSPAQRQNLAALRPAGEWLRQQSDLAAVVVASAEMFLRLDAEFHVRYASPATRAVLGYAPSEVVDADLAAEPGWGPCQEQLAQLRSGQAVAAPCHILARRRDDTEVRLEVRATRLPDGGYMLVCRDIASEVELRAQLAAAQALATALGSTDMESGLANSHRFDDALAEELRRARRAQEPLSLVLVRLAEPMDSAAQTEQARRMGRIVSAMLRRPGDLAARLDETLYAVLLPTTDRIGVQRLAERLHEAVVAALAQPAWTGACSVLPLSEAVGPEAVLDLARQALREAASPGGVGVALAVPEPERLAS